MRWIVICSVAAALAPCGFPATTAQCTAILQSGLTSGNPETRKEAVAALSLAASVGPLFDQLGQMLHDKDVEVRLAVVSSLADVQTQNATAALRKALDDAVPEVSFAAAKALWARHDPVGRTALLAVLEKESKTTSNFFTKQKRDTLRMMHTPRTAFFFAVRQGVGFVPFPGVGEGVASMEGILANSGVSGRATSALLLGTDKDPATLEALRDALADKDTAVRAAAVHSISLQNEPALKKELEPLLEDDKEAVRLRAAAGYLRLMAIENTAKQKKQPRRSSLSGTEPKKSKGGKVRD